MALPSSGLISMSQIRTEFGRSGATSLSSLYGAAAGVPTSGLISLSHFYGKSAYQEVVVRYHPSGIAGPGATVTDEAKATDGSLSTFAQIFGVGTSGNLNIRFSGSNGAHSSWWVKAVRLFAKLRYINDAQSSVSNQVSWAIRLASGGTDIVNASGYPTFNLGVDQTIDQIFTPTSIVQASSLAAAGSAYGLLNTFISSHNSHSSSWYVYEAFVEFTYGSAP
ncbi:MAG: hypothetical protein RBR77_14045 [Thauera sp.]|jgi:hypothetical protein|nr:hypothetical protein [Thauera sp.]